MQSDRLPRILVVDDDRDTANSTAEVLRRFGFEAQGIHNPRAVLDTLRAFRPAVALLDLAMPVVSGYQLAQQIRLDPDFDSIGLIAVSGYGSSEHITSTKEIGFDRHFIKPVDFANLLGAIRELTKKGLGTD